MRLAETKLEGVVEIIPSRHGDHRGYFSETFRNDWFVANIGRFSFVQDNQSLSRSAGVVRGLHFQSDPFAQGKLIRCVTGSIFDVAVDIRRGSPSFGQWTAITLTAESGNQLWVPPGFAHGFCTLEPDCVVSYKVTSYYDRDSDKGVRWDDPEIGVAWPDLADPSQLSPKDVQQPMLRELGDYFKYAKAS